MNAKLNHFNALAVSLVAGSVTIGALAFNIPSESNLFQFQQTKTAIAPLQTAVAAMDLQEDSGTAVVRLDGFTLDVSFEYSTVEDSYGVPGSDFMNAEITRLNVDQAYDTSGNKISDFTDFNDHLSINAMLVAHMLKNKMLEGV